MEDEHKHNHVRIHIDERPYHSTSPTTGEALYKLADIPDGLVLYREVQGDREDDVVKNGPEGIHLHEDEHFHSGPIRPVEITIIVNTEKKVVDTREVSYAEIVNLAFPIPPTPPPGQQIDYTVTYRRGPRKNQSGTMFEDTVVEVKEGMIFDVTPTVRS
jgi:hypothetical protein